MITAACKVKISKLAQITGFWKKILFSGLSIMAMGTCAVVRKKQNNTKSQTKKAFLDFLTCSNIYQHSQTVLAEDKDRHQTKFSKPNESTKVVTHEQLHHCACASSFLANRSLSQRWKVIYQWSSTHFHFD